MLVEFCVGNYRSFRDRVTLSLVAANLRSQDKELDENNVFEATPKLRLLTSVAIYGANASGKSNLVRAMVVMRDLVMRSAEGTNPTGGIDVEPFRLNTETVQLPSYFQVIFLLDGIRYRYGFEATSERIVSEWLHYVPKTVEAKLFVRQGDEFAFGESFREGKEFAEKVRPNALLLSVAAQFNNPRARRVVGWFRSHLGIASGLEDSSMRTSTLRALKDPQRRKEIIELVKKLDLGISGVTVETTPDTGRDLSRVFVGAPPELRDAIANLQKVVDDLNRSNGKEQEHVSVSITRPVLNPDGKPVDSVEFDLDECESEGTRKLIAMAGPLVNVLKAGCVLVIDEFDARLHPLITQAIIRLFNSSQANPNHAQLVFATHDTNLLDRRFFRRDQIWFTEKDRQGGTQLYSLAEFRVRNDASFGRDYIHGKYGAIPYLGDFERIASDES